TIRDLSFPRPPPPWWLSQRRSRVPDRLRAHRQDDFRQRAAASGEVPTAQLSVTIVMAVTVAVPVVTIPAVVIRPVGPGIDRSAGVHTYRPGCLRGLGNGQRRGQDQPQQPNTKNTGHATSPFFFAPILCSHQANVEFPDRLRMRN